MAENVQPPAAAPVPGAPEQLTEDEKLWGMLAYLIFPLAIGAIIALVTKGTSRFVKFHALQMLFMIVGLICLDITIMILCFILIFIPIIGWALMILLYLVLAVAGLGCLVMIVVLGLKANSGQIYKLPVIGNMAYKSAYGA